jgi:hypothetical protein
VGTLEEYLRSFYEDGYTIPDEILNAVDWDEIYTDHEEYEYDGMFFVPYEI